MTLNCKSSRKATLFPTGMSSNFIYPQIFNIYLKNYKVKKDLIIKPYFFNVPNSYNHKSILIALSFLRKVVSIFEI